jgi:peroxiredoxin
VLKTMKFYVMLLLALVVPCAIFGQTYEINGKVAGLNQPSIAYLYSFDKGRKLLDSTVVNNGEFSFKGMVKNPLAVSIQVKKIRKSLSLFLENEKYTILMQPDWKNRDSIVGGKEMQIQRNYDAETAHISAKMQALSSQYEKLPKEERIKEGEALHKLNEEKAAIAYKYIRKYPASLAVLHIMRPQFEIMNYNQLKEMKALFSPELAYSAVYTRLTELYHKKQSEFLVGQQAPDFTLPDAAGKSFNLSSLKGKYVVVDFWASWCTPCRAANQKIKPIYEKYKHKGFDMVSISMDDKKELWDAAVKKDGLPWHQVSALTGIKGCPVAKKYSVTSLPTVFLLDKTGKVVAQNISEQELEELLETNLN